jgi:hypothetical protein
MHCSHLRILADVVCATPNDKQKLTPRSAIAVQEYVCRLVQESKSRNSHSSSCRLRMNTYTAFSGTHKNRCALLHTFKANMPPPFHYSLHSEQEMLYTTSLSVASGFNGMLNSR